MGGIVRHIAADSSDRARELGHALLDKAFSIGAFPEIGRAVPEVGDTTVREVIHGSYHVIDEVYPDRRTVYVLRFWHAARGEPVFSKDAGA